MEVVFWRAKEPKLAKIHVGHLPVLAQNPDANDFSWNFAHIPFDYFHFVISWWWWLL
jgi:hypothetical protein